MRIVILHGAVESLENSEPLFSASMAPAAIACKAFFRGHCFGFASSARVKMRLLVRTRGVGGCKWRARTLVWPEHGNRSLNLSLTPREPISLIQDLLVTSIQCISFLSISFGFFFTAPPS